MTYTHTPKYIYIYIYIYVIIAEQFVITNLSGRISVRTLHVDCVVSASSPAHGHGVRCLQSQGTVTVTVPKSCYSLLGSIFFPNHASMLSLSA